MLNIGVHTKNILQDRAPAACFRMLRDAGFSCADFSLDEYLRNDDLKEMRLNGFFDRSSEELESFFRPHLEAAKESGIRISQMHMPYPLYVPHAGSEFNDYLAGTVAPKSLEVCAFFGCKYIVVHGFKLARQIGREAEWEKTRAFLMSIAPLARELGVTICLENLYDRGGRHFIEGPCCDARLTAGRIDRLNDALKAEVFGCCFDTGHANLVGIDFEDFITTLGGRIKVLHIHDNDGDADLHRIPFTFSGAGKVFPGTDWEGFVRGMKKIRFNGVLNFETGPVIKAYPEEMRPDVLAFINKTGRWFASKIEEI